LNDTKAKSNPFRPVAGLLLLLAVWGIVSLSPVGATRGGVPTYPKTIVHIGTGGALTEAQLDTLSWFDTVHGRFSPTILNKLKSRNPNQQYMYRIMPQMFIWWEDEQTYWYPDTSSSLMRLCQFYGLQNDWYLYDTNGDVHTQYGGYKTANWTRYCPKGTYGTSKGMTYAEWFINVAVPQIAYNSGVWDDWGWDSESYAGLTFEVMVDCPSDRPPADMFALCDPDRDGIPEGNYETCWNGGSSDSLSILFREVNHYFSTRFREVTRDDFVYQTSHHDRWSGPDWMDQYNGVKLERWRPWANDGTVEHGASWWSKFYGQYDSTGEFIAQGYYFAEGFHQPFGIDEREGWEVSYIQIITDEWGVWPDQERQQKMRWGLGTSMLGEGYFMQAPIDGANDGAVWFPEFEWDFGAAAGEFDKRLVTYLAEQDTVYYRLFENGMVEVNPYEHVLDEIPAEDSRFSFWLTVDDLSAENITAESADLRWFVPVGEVNDVDDFELRYATTALSISNWGDATSAPLPGGSYTPGEAVEITVENLTPETTYYFAIRNQVFGYLEPLTMSNQVSATTAFLLPDDETPPSAVTDLSGSGDEAGLVSLSWTTTGDDGMSGNADHFQLRYLTGEPIDDELVWAEATNVSSLLLPSPGTPGTVAQFVFSGLEPGQSYGFAVKVVDEAGNSSGLSNPLLVALPLPDTTAPAAINDLDTLMVYTDGFDLGWTAPGDDGQVGAGSSYVLGLKVGSVIEDELDWATAALITEGLPQPDLAGTAQTYRLSGLFPGVSYGLSLRAYDDEGQLSALGAQLLATTAPPPDETAPDEIVDLDVDQIYSDGFDLIWTAPGDDGAAGTATGYQLGLLTERALASESDWAEATLISVGLPAPQPAGTAQQFRLSGLDPETRYGLNLRALDEVGNISPLGNSLVLDTAPQIEVDVTAPIAINDLFIWQEFEDGFELRWLAPGDDGSVGVANRYVLGYRDGSEIATETDWEAADKIFSESAGLILPDSASAQQSYRLSGLTSGSLYGLALRAYDEAENLSALPDIPILGTTLEEIAPGDGIAPAPITLLLLGDLTPTTAQISWASTGDDSSAGVAARFVLAIAGGASPFSEADWTEAVKISELLPAPGPADSLVTHGLTSLVPGSDYRITIRAYDESDNLSAIGATLFFTTPFPADNTAPARVEDMTATVVDHSSCRLEWTATGDDDALGMAAVTQVAYLDGAAILTQADWENAELLEYENSDYSGTTVGLQLNDLTPATLYGFAVRYGDESGNWAEISNSPTVTLPDVPDLMRPASIVDLTLVDLGLDWARISWSAVGDDSLSGKATRYLPGLLASRQIDTLNFAEARGSWSDHLAANPGSVFPLPATSGTAQQYTIAGLSAGVTYGFALKVADEVENESALSNRLWFQTASEPQPLPPSRISDLTVSSVGVGWVTLSWTAPTAFEPQRTVASYELGYARSPITDENWASVLKVATPPVPAAFGEAQQFQLGPLTSGVPYYFAIRCADDNGLYAPLSNVVSAIPEVGDTQPPAAPPAPVVTLPETIDEDQVRVSWLASLESDVMGYHVYGRTENESEPVRLNESVIPQSALPDWWLSIPNRDVNYYLSISVVDYAGNESRRGTETAIFPVAFVFTGPFPHPIPLHESARFYIEMPPGAGIVALDVRIYSVSGALVRSRWRELPENEDLSGREIVIEWDGRNNSDAFVAPGLYFIRVTAGAYGETRRIYVSSGG
jgi:hypothetical protein